MAKVTGLGATCTVGDVTNTGQNITTDVTDYKFSTPYGVQDTTGVGKLAHERLLLLQDFSVTFNGVFDPGASLAHVVFSSNKRIVRTVVIINETTSSSTMTVNCLFTDYQVTRANTGQLTYSVPGVLADGTAPAWT